MVDSPDEQPEGGERPTAPRPAPIGHRDTLSRRIIRRIGPRGIEGLFGWTFFDPANLVCVTLLTVSAALVVIAMRGRGAPDWQMPLGLYLCLAVFLRGYFFSYYHGRSLGRVVVLVVLLLGLGISATLWEDRAGAYEMLRRGEVVRVPPAEGFHVAALLHLASAITLFVHALMPRRWLIRATDELADRGGADTAPDAPIETISDPLERARRTGRFPAADDDDDDTW